LFIGISCSEEPAENCTGILCPFFVGNWQLSEVTQDGQETDHDYSGYHLNLKAPEAGEVFADYTRAFGNGLDEQGTWTVANNNDVLVLSADGENEEYIVEDSGSGHLVLVLHRTPEKPGPEQIRYVFKK
jgi:hypothetical protein